MKIVKEFKNTKKQMLLINRALIFRIICSLSIMLVSTANVFAVELINHDFNDGTFGTLSHGSFWTIQNSGGVNDSSAARLEYSESGTAQKAMFLGGLEQYGTDFWIEFDVKAENTPSGGSKFVKIFGVSTEHSWNNINNITLALKYTSNEQMEISYHLDTICAARYDGSSAGSCTPTFLHSSGGIDITGGGWGHYKAHVKRADYQVANGTVTVWWNGQMVVDIAGMDSQPTAEYHSPYISRIEFGGYNHSLFNGNTWYLWIDNLHISTQESDVTCYPDVDSDLYPGTGSETVATCSANHYEANHFTAMTIDCNDNDNTVHPNATDICGNGVAENCIADVVCSEIRADVDQSGAIDTIDALLTLRNSLGLDMSSTNWQPSATTGDVNCDNSSNSTDASLVLRSSLGLEMSGTGWCGS